MINIDFKSQQVDETKLSLNSITNNEIDTKVHDENVKTIIIDTKQSYDKKNQMKFIRLLDVQREDKDIKLQKKRFFQSMVKKRITVFLKMQLQIK